MRSQNKSPISSIYFCLLKPLMEWGDDGGGGWGCGGVGSGGSEVSVCGSGG